MIRDDPRSPWIWVRRASEWEREKSLHEWIEFAENGGKWVITGTKERLEELAVTLDPYVERGEIPDIKYSRRPGVYGPLPAMCVFCYERDRDRVAKILADEGVEAKRWRSEQETLLGFAPGGRHYIEIHGGQREETKINNCIVEIFERDIVWMEVDAIVNSTTPDLKMEVGLSGHIARVGGLKIIEECERIGGASVGDAVITAGGELKARYVIHAVGPQMGEGDEDEKLRNTMLSSLKLADKHGIKSVAFPAISTGRFRFPLDRSAKIMLQTAVPYVKGSTGLERLVFCVFGKENFQVFHRELEARQK